MKKRVANWLAVGLALVSSAQSMAEGAVKLLDCTLTRVCDETGDCEDAQGQFVFRMEPTELGPGGTGRYELAIDGSVVEMQALSDSGPFIWNRDRERNALIASSESDWLWHQLRLDPIPGSSIRFLRCSFQQ